MLHVYNHMENACQHRLLSNLELASHLVRNKGNSLNFELGLADACV